MSCFVILGIGVPDGGVAFFESCLILAVGVPKGGVAFILLKDFQVPAVRILKDGVSLAEGFSYACSRKP